MAITTKVYCIPRLGKAQEQGMAGVEARGVPLPASRAAISLQCPHVAEGLGGLSSIASVNGTDGVSTRMLPSRREVRLQDMNLEGAQNSP